MKINLLLQVNIDILSQNFCLSIRARDLKINLSDGKIVKLFTVMGNQALLQKKCGVVGGGFFSFLFLISTDFHNLCTSHLIFLVGRVGLNGIRSGCPADRQQIFNLCRQLINSLGSKSVDQRAALFRSVIYFVPSIFFSEKVSSLCK